MNNNHTANARDQPTRLAVNERFQRDETLDDQSTNAIIRRIITIHHAVLAATAILSIVV